MNERLITVRKYFHRTQKDFGDALGVSRDVISNIEYGRVKPKELLLAHICQVYGVNQLWLETGEGKMFTAPPARTKKLEEAIKLFESLRPEFQDYALEQIQNLLELQQLSDSDKNSHT